MIKEALERLGKEPAPLIDHDTVTFLWRGRSAPGLVGDFTGWEDGEPVRLEKLGSGLWAYQHEFPADAYIEYSFMKDGESLLDPLNPRQTSNGVGGFNNYFCMPGYHPTDLIQYYRKIAHGTLKKFTLPTDYYVVGDVRTIHLYRPPVPGPVPLLVVWDGWEYLKRVRLNYMLDNLISQGRIKPLAVAFVTNGGQDSRVSEYACSEATLLFLMNGVLPLAKKELDLLDYQSYPGEYGVLGSSMGGLMALHTGLRLPHVFGKVISQSGAFTQAGLDMVVYSLVEQCQPRPLDIWMDVGRYDLPGLQDTNRRMHALLSQRGYPVTFREFHAGHNYPAWRDDLWRGLVTLYGVHA